MIERKIANARALDYPAGCLEVVVASDGSSDRTAELARAAGAETIDLSKEDSFDRLSELTRGKLPNRCIDAVGMEAHGASVVGNLYDKAKTALMLETDRPHVLREAIMSCRNGGTVSIVGVYVGLLDKVPFGSAMNRGLTFKMAQTPVPKYMGQLLERVQKGEIDPSFVITHTVGLEDGPKMYETFRDKKDGCIKVMIRP